MQVDNGPLISGVGVSPGLTASSVRVAWSTDLASEGQVEYGATPAYGSLSPLDPQAAVRHEIQLTGLSPGTLYHYRVRSRDANGAVANSSDQTFFTP